MIFMIPQTTSAGNHFWKKGGERMKQRIQPIKRAFIALLAVMTILSLAGCSLFDPVVSVGTPSPALATSANPEETALPVTPQPKPAETPASESSALPDTTPNEANGAGAYTITADASESKKTYYSEHADENALRVENGAIAGIDGASVEKRAGDATSLENVLQYGLNAAVLSRATAQLLLVNSEVTSAALGAGGVFVIGGRTQLQSSVVRATGASAFAIAASGGGLLNAKDTNLTTQGATSPAIIANQGGTIEFSGGMAATAGEDSPVIRAQGSVSVESATLRANNAEAIAVDGGSVTLVDCAVSGRMSDAAAGTQSAPYCVALYQSRGENSATSSFSMTRGALSAIRGDLFYVTNTTASIDLEGVSLALGEGRAFLRVSGNDGSRGWGEAEHNGASCTVRAKDQIISGDVVVDELSSVSLTLRGESAFTGTVNAANTARAAKVTLEGSATWTLTGNAYLSAFTGRIGGIVTNGFTVFVNGVALTD
jgi:hypothetical protein